MKPFLEILNKQPSTETGHQRRLHLLNYVARDLIDGLDYATLFTLLDDKSYKQAKLAYDPSTRLYAQDLDLGRKAAAAESLGTVEQINHLPHLWRYALLRCSLTSRVDAYPDAAFLLLFRLGQQEQAERSAGLLTSPAQRARVLSLLGSEYALQPERADQSVQLFEQSYASTQSVVDKTERNTTLSALGQACIQGSQFSLARRVILSIEDNTKRTEGLKSLSQAYSQAGQWEPARDVIALLEDSHERDTALKVLAQALVRFGKWQLAWEIFSTIKDSEEKAQELVAFGAAVAQANYLQTALPIWREALRVILSNENNVPANVSAAGDLAKALLDTDEQEAIQLWQELSEAVMSIEVPLARDIALYGLCQSLMRVNAWEQVMELVSAMQTSIVIKVLGESGQALITLSEEFGQAGKEEEAAGIRDFADQIWQMSRNIIAAVESGSTKTMMLRMFVESLIQAHQEQEALQVWHESRDMPLTRDNAYEFIRLGSLLAQAYHGEEALDILSTIEQALDVLSTIEDSEKRERTYYEMVKALLATQQWQIARKVSHTIHRSHFKTWGFKETYHALIQAREWQLALDVIEELHQEEIQDQRLMMIYMTGDKSGGVLKEERFVFSDEADVLQELQEVLAQTKDAQEAVKVWQEMQGIFTLIPRRDDDEVNEKLRGLVEVLAQRGQWQAALDVVKSIKGYTERSVATREFCQLLSKAHRWQEAREIAASIQENSEHARALSELGLELIAAGQRQEADQTWQETQQALPRTASFWRYSQALRSLSLGLAQSPQWWNAQQIIHMIEDDEEKAIALGELGRELVLLGEDDEAVTAWQTARSIAANIISSDWQARALGEIGQAMTQARHEQEAWEVWQEAQKAIADIGNSSSKIERANELAQKMIRAGQWRQIQDMFISVSGNTETNTNTNKDLRELGSKLIQANKLQEAYEVLKVLAAISHASAYAEYANKLANELSRAFIKQGNLQEARAMLDNITGISERVQALSELSLAMARAHHEPESQQIWQEIRDFIRGIIIEEETQKPNSLASFMRKSDLIYQKAKGLRILAQTMAQAGHEQEALQVWQEARDLVQTFEDSPRQVEELRDLGLVMAQTGHEQEALQVWQEARDLIQTFEDSPRQVEELRSLGLVMAQAGHEQEAFQVWQEALAIIATIKVYSEKVRALSSLGQTMTQANQEQQGWGVWQEALAIIISTDERIVEVLASIEETVTGKQPDAATRESYLKGARTMRKTNQQLAQEYQGNQWQKTHESNIEALDAIASGTAGPDSNMQNAGHLVGDLRIGFAFNSVSAAALSGFSQVLAEAGHWQEAREVLIVIEDQPSLRDDAWMALARSLTRLEHWQEACNAATSVEDARKRTEMLKEIVTALAQKKQWQLAWKTLATIEDGDKRTEALRELSSAVMQFYNEVHQEVVIVYRNATPKQDTSPEQERQRTDALRYDDYLQLLTLLRQVWTELMASEEILAAFPLVQGFVQRDPEMGKTLAQSFTLVADFLRDE